MAYSFTELEKRLVPFLVERYLNSSIRFATLADVAAFGKISEKEAGDILWRFAGLGLTQQATAAMYQILPAIMEAQERLDAEQQATAVPPQQSLAKVFYSWQSDLPNSTNRGFIEDCLERAIKELKADPELQVDPCLDRDTQNVPGSPDIASTIFDKIDHCGLFVCDVSIVSRGSSERPTPNPNVLIELGYAVKTLGWSRIVCVFNAAFGNIQALPFDLRQRRVRSYNLQQGSEKAEQRKLLTCLLEADLRNIFDVIVPQQDTASDEDQRNADIHSIRFSVDDWKAWREPSHDLGSVMVISGWREGCIRYSCKIRLRNESGVEEEIHRLRMEFRQGETVLLADTYAFDDRGVTLPPKKWVTLDVCHGFHEDGVFAESDSVWFAAETVGDNSKVAWQIATINDRSISLAEEVGE